MNWLENVFIRGLSKCTKIKNWNGFIALDWQNSNLIENMTQWKDFSFFERVKKLDFIKILMNHC